MSAVKPIIVISGLGNAVGTGASVARLFASSEVGYRVALVSRPREEVDALAKELRDGGGEAEVFSLETYDYPSIAKVFKDVKEKWFDGRVKAAVWNTGQWSNIPFLSIKESDITLSTQINIVAATAFAQESIKAFKLPSSSIVEGGPEYEGTLLVTGATSAWRGSAQFGAFAAGKHGLRAVTQSIAREYGPQGVHAAFIVIDGTILTKRTSVLFGKKFGDGWLNDERQRLAPESIAKCYKYLHEQTPDAWTLEMDLRPAKEKF